MDSTAANTIHGTSTRAERHGIRIFITGASPAIRHVLFTHGVRPPLVEYRETIDDALAEVHTTSRA